jgi:EAL domain-containing protein (putative c-di-GMP-specific phosphodiesterase class I)/CheY-like chemotaxis protein
MSGGNEVRGNGAANAPVLAVATEGATKALGLGRVLAVDDDRAVLRALCRTLERAGHEVRSIDDGRSACEVLSRMRPHEIDVVVADISMPGADGLEVMRHAHRMDPDLPVLLMTGLPTVESAVQALEQGALRYLLKPLDPAALIDAVAKAVTLREGIRDGIDARASLTPSYQRVRVGLEQRFESALANVHMVFQPIVAYGERRVHAYEALARSSEGTLGQPEALFDAAEQLHRVRDLSRAIRMAVARSIAGAPASAEIFVNLHAEDLGDDDLFSSTAPLTQYASRIVLEITERAPMDNIPDIHDRITALRSHGFRIAIDDLGAGYAALSSLANLQPEVVKLDMSLVRGIDHTPIKQRLVAALQTLSEPLGIQVVAEGVETPAERDALVAQGCDLFQGYLFAHPGFPFPVARF